jgi:hypothetical protein
MQKLRTILPILVLTFMVYIVAAQVPRFTKYDVAETGAKVYMPTEVTFERSESEDGSDVYTAECEFAEVKYYAIVVHFADNLGDDPDAWEELLISYMDFLREALEIEDWLDPGKGHTLDSHPEARGVINYGANADGREFSFKGWVDDEMLAVLIIEHVGEMNYNVQQMYLNGFRFPE